MDTSPDDKSTPNPLLLWDDSEVRSRLRRLLGSSPNTPEVPLDSDELPEKYDAVEDDKDEDDVVDLEDDVRAL